MTEHDHTMVHTDSSPALSEYLGGFFTSDFMPHGHCYFWKPDILWLHVASDAIVALAYYSIPIVLIYITRKRRDLPFSKIFIMFGAFILLCGTTHLMSIYTTWVPLYRLEGILKLLTALISIATAAVLFPIMPKLLSLPSLQSALKKLEKKTQELLKTNQEYERFHKVVMGRENRIIELKKEVNHLTQELGRKPPYAA